MARNKSILTEAKQIERAVTLIHLGARLQVLESETDLSYERLLRLYKEVAGKSPSKGQLPFSTDWFMTWQPNIHASLFLNTHEYLNKVAALEEIDSVIKAYKLYAEQMQSQGLEPLLSITRAWRLVKFVDNGMLTMTACSKCKGHFVTHPHEIARHYVCGMCNPPARAGKGKLSGSLGNALGSEVESAPAVSNSDELYADVQGDDELHTILRAEAELRAESATELAPVALVVAKAANKPRAKTSGAQTRH
jgi:flagellar transcriptional activator FlhC